MFDLNCLHLKWYLRKKPFTHVPETAHFICIQPIVNHLMGCVQTFCSKGAFFRLEEL